MPHRVSDKAQHDIRRIYLEGTERFGIAQAERYAAGLDRTFLFLAEHPRAARRRTELSPPVFAYPYGSHLIVYDIDDDGTTVILRIRHGREDWISDPL